MHSSVGNIGITQLAPGGNAAAMNTGPSTAMYKTNTLDQYGQVAAGRNSALTNHSGGNLNAMAIGPSTAAVHP